MYKPPPPGGRGGGPLRVLIYISHFGPKAGSQNRGDGGHGQRRRNRRKHAEEGTLALRHKGCSEGRAGALGGYIQRRVEQINKASQEGALSVQAGSCRGYS